ncbi:serine hydrolase domain-containing protein [Croceivirga thetidis]|uniref:Beta-lactamase family protein n=1 Tax=Croceivirga thetidis TaxID=2721623 RepID=A0ABX1GKU9_9FLAO|nr:serine hydrolase domain-containing protein [Croceivirga thetidis]NKI30493.1 beta-lactamase family protein [Croceivirga thetidis]
MSVLRFFQNLFRAKPEPQEFQTLPQMERAAITLQNLVEEEKVPGISVTILKNGESLLQKGYGYADISNQTPVDPLKTQFRIASISKCITGLAFGKMVEEGILNWDDSLYEYVPYYPKKKYDFTLRQLASHTAGVRGYRGKEFAMNRPFGIKESIEVFKDDPLVFEPGTDYLYNSFDFVLLSLAMQEASGIPFQDYVAEKVLRPLDMSSTMAPKDDKSQSIEIGQLQLAKFYTKRASRFKNAIEVANFYKLAGGGYLSTSADIAKMGLAILEGKLLKKKTFDQLFSSQQIGKNQTYYGLGYQVSQDRMGNSFIGHVGSSVGAYTNFFVYPEHNLVYSFLINCTDPKVQAELDLVVESTLLYTSNSMV